MATDSSWASGYATLLSAVETVPFACPCAFGPGDRYQLEELVAITGKSWVYRATDQRFAHEGEAPRVAIKVCRLVGSSTEAFLGRKVEHDGVVRLTDHGRTEEGHSYVVMDWMDDGDLGRSDVPWSSRDAARFMAKLARIVQAAHSVFVAHCDLKPSNVLLTRDREPRLADFDLAQRISDVSCSRKGTLAFMSPEQYRGDVGGHGIQSDIYALGGILHFLVIGAPPHGEEAETIAARLRAGDVPECPGIEPGLAGVIRRALSPDLSFRYATAHELAVDLERWLAYLPLDWQAPRPHTRVRLWLRRHPAAAVALAAVVIGGAAAAAARSEWVRREAVREAAVATTSDIKAREKFDSVGVGVRSVLAQAGRVLTAERRNQMNNEEILASITVMQWLEMPPLHRDGKTSESLHRYGVDMWTELLTRGERNGTGTDSLSFFAHINLARLALDVSDYREAAEHAGKAEQSWGKQLPENDSAKIALKVVRAVVSNELRDPQGQGDLATGDLAALEEEAKRAGIGDSLLRHLRRVRQQSKEAVSRR